MSSFSPLATAVVLLVPSYLCRRLLLCALFLPSCSDSAAIPATSPADKPNAASESVLLDEALLRDAGLQRLETGGILRLAYDTAGSFPIPAASVEVRDTAVVAFGQGGVLQARREGSAWLVWPYADGKDSTLVTVRSTSLQDDGFVVPTSPSKTVDVRYPTARGRGLGAGKSWRVAQGEDLQSVLNSAQPGDEVVLAQGTVFVGNFKLPAKADNSTDWIVVRSEVVPVANGTRITPSLARGVARIETPNQDPAIVTVKNTRRWRLVGFEIAHKQGAVYNYGIVVLGWGNEVSVADEPSDIVLDRMYIHGQPTQGNSRCVAFNGRSLAVINSWLSECHAVGQDAQGVWGGAGPGPFLIENNRIEASGQAIMFGGSDPLIANLSPSDIIIRRNHLFKPLSWAHGKWTVKATFELKHARRVLFEYNVLENHWADAQEGYAILFQAASQSERAPWTTIEDVMVRNNIIRNSLAAVDLLARTSPLIVSPTSRVAIINNLWENVGRDPLGSGFNQQLVLLLGALRDVTVAQNTFILSEGQVNAVVYFDGRGATHTTIINNLFPKSTYGVGSSGAGFGAQALSAFAPGGPFSGNVIPGISSEGYPANNFFPEIGPQRLAAALVSADGCTFGQNWLTGRGLASTIGANCDALIAANAAVVVDTPP